MEVKWSDRAVTHPEELKSLLSFCHQNNLSHAFVTTKTVSGQGARESVSVSFFPAAAMCFLLGELTLAARKDLGEDRLNDLLSVKEMNF